MGVIGKAAPRVTAPRSAQSAHAVLMLRPRTFGFNTDTSTTNSFAVARPEKGAQAARAANAGPALARRAIQEFDAAVSALEAAGIEVVVLQDVGAPAKPDAVFVNNWISFHADGTVVLYPMLHVTRRTEVRRDVLTLLEREHGFRVGDVVDFTGACDRSLFLEGTGSLVLDRAEGGAYACLSPRTSEGLLREYCQRLTLQPVVFRAVDRDGQAIYHTNVMLSLGTDFGLVCAEAIVGAGDRARVLMSIRATGREVIEITSAQMHRFAGNLLEVRDQEGRPRLVMSRSAHDALEGATLRQLAAHAEPLVLEIPTIEEFGGGSARCMLAEVHLPRVGSPPPPR